MAKYTPAYINAKTGNVLLKTPKITPKNVDKYQLILISPQVNVIPFKDLKASKANYQLLSRIAEESNSLPEIKGKLAGRGKESSNKGRYVLETVNAKGKRIIPKTGKEVYYNLIDNDKKEKILLKPEGPQVFQPKVYERLQKYIAGQKSDKVVIYETVDKQLAPPDKRSKLRGVLFDRSGKEERSLTKAHFKLDTVELIKAEAMNIVRITPDKKTVWHIPREAKTLRDSLSQQVLSFTKLPPGKKWSLEIEIKTKMFGEEIYIFTGFNPNSRIEILRHIESAIIERLAHNGLTFTKLKTLKEFAKRKDDPVKVAPREYDGDMNLLNMRGAKSLQHPRNIAIRNKLLDPLMTYDEAGRVYAMRESLTPIAKDGLHITINWHTTKSSVKKTRRIKGKK